MKDRKCVWCGRHIDESFLATKVCGDYCRKVMETLGYEEDNEDW